MAHDKINKKRTSPTHQCCHQVDEEVFLALAGRQSHDAALRDIQETGLSSPFHGGKGTHSGGHTGREGGLYSKGSQEPGGTAQKVITSLVDDAERGGYGGLGEVPPKRETAWLKAGGRSRWNWNTALTVWPARRLRRRIAFWYLGTGLVWMIMSP